MTQDQAAVLQSIQEEYWQYLDGLEKRSKGEIINESGRTQFYADIVLYLTDHTVAAKRIDALDTADVLNKLYTAYLADGLDNITRAGVCARVIFGFAKQNGAAM